MIAQLRAKDVAQEDVAALVGHEQGSVTGGYGGQYPLIRKLKTVQKLEYSIDVLSALGGPYKKEIHG